eukprot:scaffold1610_cov257-Pinguiococcus_pyrenoidosus.AAC.1
MRRAGVRWPSRGGPVRARTLRSGLACDSGRCFENVVHHRSVPEPQERGEERYAASLCPLRRISADFPPSRPFDRLKSRWISCR